ncbi:MAG: hypothetical protein U0795_23225 [Pirellulales bacterium]
MSRWSVIGLSIAIALSGVSAAWAQRDAGAKMRGDYRSFWDPAYNRGSARPVYRPADSFPVVRESVSGYRSFSYAPVLPRPGDLVAVAASGVPLMDGQRVVGSLPGGTQFQVKKVTKGWLATVVQIDGRDQTGWVWHENVQPIESLRRPEAARGIPSPSVYRSFSYEPQAIAVPRNVLRPSQNRDPWMYPKTDRRRFSPY